MILSKGVFAQTEDLVQYVNTLYETNSKHGLTHGNTHPTTALPFGMNFRTPQKGKNGVAWKYPFFQSRIRGFQQALQCSSWTNGYAVFSLMSTIYSLVVNQNIKATGFKCENDIAKPHYYKVTFENNITTEMLFSERGVHLHATSQKGLESYLTLTLDR